MREPRTLFFDVGGVLLTNGWDSASRRAVIEECNLDWEEFEDRHQYVAGDFELGKLDLDAYLERTVFYRTRDFTADHFFSLMKGQSKQLEPSMALLARLSATGAYRMATLNNESRALNDYRIDRFGLRNHFQMFLSSCYLGLKKPEPEIFALALDITKTRPDEAVFIDDRPLNLECAVRAGMPTIEFRNVEHLEASLVSHGVRLEREEPS